MYKGQVDTLTDTVDTSADPIDTVADPVDTFADPVDTLADPVDSLAAPVPYTHHRAHDTKANLVCRLLLEKQKKARSTIN